MRNAENKPTPLAYGYAENGLLHTELHWAQMDEVCFAKTIGADLVDFAYIDDGSLYAVILEINGLCRSLAEKQASVDDIACAVLQRCEPVLRLNLYFSIYLMSFLDFLFDGTIDERVFPGASRAERRLRKMAMDARNADVMDVIDHIFEAYQSKRKLAESALRAIYEDETGTGLTPLERYYRREQEDALFQKQLHAVFTVKLGRRAAGDRSVTQLTVLDTVDDLLRYELFLLVTQGRRYKFCKNCGKPFIPSGRSDTVYCDRVMDGADKPCSEIGAYIADVKKVASDPVLSAYRKAYQRLHKRVELGYM
ncbi:MAG: hypothetical protein J5449_06005, partial [Oscillospiraceae bacterium]|nr:hypothetical protein [Oscillospiraceae bacterium]